MIILIVFSKIIPFLKVTSHMAREFDIVNTFSLFVYVYLAAKRQNLMYIGPCGIVEE